MPKDREYPKQYYVLRIGQFIDSFSPELSDDSAWLPSEVSKDMYFVKYPNKECMSGLVMKKSSFGHAQLWREKKLEIPDYFFSDELHDAIVEAKLRVPRFYKLKEA